MGSFRHIIRGIYARDIQKRPQRLPCPQQMPDKCPGLVRAQRVVSEEHAGAGVPCPPLSNRWSLRGHITQALQCSLSPTATTSDTGVEMLSQSLRHKNEMGQVALGQLWPLLIYLPYPILRRLSSTSQSRAVPCSAWLRGAPAGGQDISIFPGGHKFASAGDATVRIWDLDPLLNSVELTPSEPEVSHVVFSPVQPVIFTSFFKSEVTWARSLEDGSVVARLDGHTGGVFSMSLSPDGTLLACGAGDGTIRVWNTQTGTEHLSYRPQSNAVTALVFSPDGKLLASATSSHVCIFDLMEKRLDTPIQGLGFVFSAAFSPDGSLVAFGGYDRFLIWDAERQQRITKPDTHSSPVFYSLCFTSDATALIGEGTGESLTAWNSSNGQQIELTDEHRTTFLESKQQFNRQWRCETEQAEKQRTEDKHQHEQISTIITDGITGKPVAWLPMFLGGVGRWLTRWKDSQGSIVYLPMVRRGVDWHPTANIWTNRLSDQLSLFKLEGQT